MFITFEGPEGSGKSTQIKILSEKLIKSGRHVVFTREPGGTNIGDQIRDVLFKLKNTAMFPQTEILLFQASRAQLVNEIIRPNLEKGRIVLCDRYADSTLAYQGYGHEVNIDQLSTIINFATGELKPDLTLLLDIDVEKGLNRRTKGGNWNRLDAYEVEFHKRVRAGYHKLVSEETDRWIVIDADQKPEQVQNAIYTAVSDRLPKQKSVKRDYI